MRFMRRSPRVAARRSARHRTSRSVNAAFANTPMQPDAAVIKQLAKAAGSATHPAADSLYTCRGSRHIKLASYHNVITANCKSTHIAPILRSLQKGKDNPYSICKRMVPELISVLGGQPAGDVSHKPGGRLPLLSARPAVTPATLN